MFQVSGFLTHNKKSTFELTLLTKRHVCDKDKSQVETKKQKLSSQNNELLNVMKKPTLNEATKLLNMFTTSFDSKVEEQVFKPMKSKIFVYIDAIKPQKVNTEVEISRKSSTSITEENQVKINFIKGFARNSKQYIDSGFEDTTATSKETKQIDSVHQLNDLKYLGNKRQNVHINKSDLATLIGPSLINENVFNLIWTSFNSVHKIIQIFQKYIVLTQIFC